MITKALFFAPLLPVVLNDKRLSFIDRAILSIVIQLSRKTGRCFAPNKYFAENLSCSIATVSKSIKKLEKATYILVNRPNGRGNYRTVRPDLIYKSATLSEDDSLLNKTSLPSEKTKHTYMNTFNSNNNNISAEQEKKIVNEKLKTIFGNKSSYFDSVKKVYNENFPMLWNEINVSDLITLCNMLDETYREPLLKVQRRNRFNHAIELFELLITSKPNFFTDSKPATFVRFYNTVITQETFLNKLKHILYPHQRDGFFGSGRKFTD